IARSRRVCPGVPRRRQDAGLGQRRCNRPGLGLDKGQVKRVFTHEGWVRSLALSSNGSLLAAASSYPDYGKTFLWNFKTGERLHTWKSDESRSSLRGVTFDRENASVIAAWGNGSLQRWDVSTGAETPIAQPKLEKVPPRPGDGLEDISKLAVSPDRRSLGMI